MEDPAVPPRESADAASSEAEGRRLAAKRRASARAVGSTMLIGGVLGLVLFFALRLTWSLGLEIKHLLFVVVLAVITVAVLWERKGWSEDHRLRVARRRKHRGALRASVRAATLSDGPPTGPPEGSRAGPRRARPHPSLQPADTWWSQLLFVALLLACAAGVFAILAAQGDWRPW